MLLVTLPNSDTPLSATTVCSHTYLLHTYISGQEVSRERLQLLRSARRSGASRRKTPQRVGRSRDATEHAQTGD